MSPISTDELYGEIYRLFFFHPTVRSTCLLSKNLIFSILFWGDEKKYLISENPRRKRFDITEYKTGFRIVLK